LWEFLLPLEEQYGFLDQEYVNGLSFYLGFLEFPSPILGFSTSLVPYAQYILA
jgi:hypothetical protein